MNKYSEIKYYYIKNVRKNRNITPGGTLGNSDKLADGGQAEKPVEINKLKQWQ